MEEITRFTMQCHTRDFLEVQKVDILVPRIPDFSGRKSGHFQIVAADISIFGIKG